MKKALSLLVAAGVAAACMSSMALAETNINACIASEPETLDPNLESSVDGATYAMHMFENLMKYNQTEDNAALDDSDNVKLLVPDYGQAESYDVSDDGLVYTFHLRDDIFWSDGEPVTAANWEYS